MRPYRVQLIATDPRRTLASSAFTYFDIADLDDQRYGTLLDQAHEPKDSKLTAPLKGGDASMLDETDNALLKESDASDENKQFVREIDRTWTFVQHGIASPPPKPREGVIYSTVATDETKALDMSGDVLHVVLNTVSNELYLCPSSQLPENSGNTYLFYTDVGSLTHLYGTGEIKSQPSKGRWAIPHATGISHGLWLLPFLMMGSSIPFLLSSPFIGGLALYLGYRQHRRESHHDFKRALQRKSLDAERNALKASATQHSYQLMGSMAARTFCVFIPLSAAQLVPIVIITETLSCLLILMKNKPEQPTAPLAERQAFYCVCIKLLLACAIASAIWQGVAIGLAAKPVLDLIKNLGKATNAPDLIYKAMLSCIAAIGTGFTVSLSTRTCLSHCTQPRLFQQQRKRRQVATHERKTDPCPYRV